MIGFGVWGRVWIKTRMRVGLGLRLTLEFIIGKIVAGENIHSLFSFYNLKGKFSSGIEGAVASALNHDFN